MWRSSKDSQSEGLKSLVVLLLKQAQAACQEGGAKFAPECFLHWIASKS